MRRIYRCSKPWDLPVAESRAPWCLRFSSALPEVRFACLRGPIALCGESDRSLKVSGLKQPVYGPAARVEMNLARAPRGVGVGDRRRLRAQIARKVSMWQLDSDAT